MTDGNEILVQVPAFAALPWLRHGFSTRSGGVSTIYDPNGVGDLNLGWTRDDDPANVAENRRRLVAAAGIPDAPLVTVRQVHTAQSLIVADSVVAASFVNGEGRAIHEGDGLISGASGVLLGIQTADCVPVLVVDTDRRVVAAFHAGWRGTVARIVEHGVARMAAEFGSRPRDMLAAIGPSIGACCYTVGDQVRREFTEAFSYGEALFRHKTSPAAEGEAPPLHLDLWEANRRQLLDAGLAPEKITVVGECTGCAGLGDGSGGRRRYFSHRCEHGFTGRMMNVIGIANSPSA